MLTREADRYGSISLSAFYRRRAIRLLPPLLVTLALAAVACWFGLISGEIDARSLASQIFFFSNYYNLYGPAHQGLGGTGVLWSLAVEEHFYLLFPLLFILLFRGAIGIRHIVALVVLVLAWRCARIALWGTDEWTIYFSSDTRIDSILFGCLLALLEWRGFRFPEGRAAWLILAVAACLLLPTFIVSSDFFRSTFRYSLQGLALMPFFFYAVHKPSALPFRPLNWPLARRIGVYSYSIYLSHDVFIDALGRQGASTVSVLIVAGALSVGYAALLHELVEKPFRGMRSRTVGHPVQAGAAAGPAAVERASDDTLQPGRGAGTQPAFGRGRMP
ncbi:MAG: acyltransferase [Mesorhizobium sp.]